MVGLIRRLTPNYELQIPNYDIAGWGTAMTKNFDIVDAVLFAVTGLGNIRGEWTNSTLYDAADRVVDPDDGGVWQCSVTHTSAASGTFAADRAAHSTYWTQIVGSVAFRGQWTTGVVYNVNEFLYFDHQYAVTAQAFTGGASYAADVAAGKIVTLIDLRADLTTSTTAATNAAASAAAASGSQSAAATSATNAGNSATAAAASQSAAATSASNAATSAANALTSANNADTSEANALASQNAAAASATAANNSAIDAAASALAAQTWNPANYYTKTESDNLYKNATNLTSGTVNKDRLPATQNATTFSNDVVVQGSGNLHVRYKEGAIDRAIAYYDIGSDAYNVNIYNAAGTFVRAFSLTESGAISWSGNTVWHAGNDGSGSGLDAGLLEGQNGAFYRSASNINAGTLADARLPTSMAGKAFTTSISVGNYAGGLSNVFIHQDGFIEITNTSGNAGIDFKNAAGDDYDARIIQSGGSLDIVTTGGGTLGVNGSGVVTAANLATNMNSIVYNAVGAIAMMRRTSSVVVDQGQTSAGSNLVFSNADGSYTSGAATGTWEALGRTNASAGAPAVTCWRRIS